MALNCPHCNAPVGEDASRCPECGTELDALLTIPLPSQKRGLIPKAVKPAKPAKAAKPPRPSPPPKPEPSRARPVSAPPSAPPPKTRPAPPTADNPPQFSGAEPAQPSPVQAAAPSGIRAWIINKLGGQLASAPPAQPSYQPAPQPSFSAPPPPPVSYSPSQNSPPYPAQPPQYAPAPAPPAPLPVLSPQNFAPQAPAPPVSLAPERPPAPAPAPAPEPPRPVSEQFSPRPADVEGKTVSIGGIDVEKFKFPKFSYVLEILDKGGQWRVWEPIRVGGLNVGRKQSSARFPALASMAARHLRLSYDRLSLRAEDLGSLNGVYVKIDRPIELVDGTRFRVGNQVIEFHRAEPFQAVPAMQSNDGEEFWSRDVEPVAYLDLIRPNDQPGLRFPLTKPDQMVIGREGAGLDIALAGDELASAPHARVRRQDAAFYLEDMNSRNGTYVQIRGTAALKSGDVLLVGRVLLRVVEQPAGA